MPTPSDWSVAFAKQARADMSARNALLKHGELPACQQLHFLQMACEKLCKAHLCASGSDPAGVQASHDYIGTVLPVVFRMQFSQKYKRDLSRGAELLKRIRHLAREINFLAPTVNDNGRRPDNCEYPWKDRETVAVPLEREFPNLDFLKAPGGILFIKLLDTAIDELCAPPSLAPNF